MATSLLALSHPPPVAFLDWIVSVITTLYTLLVTENPLIWKKRQGKNKCADGRGPYYVQGAPFKQIEEGKGILASLDFLKKHGVYLFTGRITDQQGHPVVGATVDFWHACTAGHYYFDRYELRGKVKTDSNGRFEVLSVPPGPYLGRAGHFHYIITPAPSDRNKYEDLTTQSYVCTANNTDEMNHDFVNTLYMRDPPHNLMVNSWCLPEVNGGKRLFDFPTMADIVADESARDKITRQIKEWNDRFAGLEDYKGENALRVMSGGHKEVQLSPKGTLGLC